MTAPLQRLYNLDHPETLVLVFDLRHSNGPAELHRHRAALAEHADIEALDEDLFVLVVRPGWTLERAA